MSRLPDEQWRPGPELHAGNPVPEVRSCNRHHNCDAADERARREWAKRGAVSTDFRGQFGAEHCRNDECEECYGC